MNKTNLGWSLVKALLNGILCGSSYTVSAFLLGKAMGIYPVSLYQTSLYLLIPGAFLLSYSERLLGPVPKVASVQRSALSSLSKALFLFALFCITIVLWDLPSPSYAVLCLGLLLSFVISLLLDLLFQRLGKENREERVLIVGAGARGVKAGNVLKREGGRLHPLGYIDDYYPKHECCGLPVLGETEDLMDLIDSLQVDWVLFALPSSAKEKMDSLSKAVEEKGVRVATLPIDEILFSHSRLKREMLGPLSVYTVLRIDAGEGNHHFPFRRAL